MDVFTVAVILFGVFSFVTLFSVVYYLVVVIIFKKNDGHLAYSMWHIIIFGTIIAVCCVFGFSSYFQARNYEERLLAYDNGYAEALSDLQLIIQYYAPASYDGLSFWEYLDSNCESEDDLYLLIEDMEYHINKSDLVFELINYSTPEYVKEASEEIISGGN